MQKLFTILAVLFTGCSTTDTDKLLEAGMYQNAITALEKQLTSSPHDEEIMIKLGGARTGYLGKKLIQTRMQRLSGDRLGALVSLQDFFTKQRSWGVKLNAAVSESSLTEVSKAWDFIRIETNQKVQQGFPLAAVHLLNSHHLVVANIQSRGAKANLIGAVKNSGRKKCQSLISGIGAKQPTYSQLIHQYCTVFGGKMPRFDASHIPGYGGLNSTVLMDFSGLTKDGYESEIKQKLTHAFKRSLWYNPNSREKLKLKGKMKSRYRRAFSKKMMKHQYFVKDPFIAHEIIPQKQQRIKLVNQNKKFSYQDCTKTGCSQRRGSISLPVPQLIEVQAKNRQKITRYKEIPHVFRYPVEEVIEQLRIHLMMTAGNESAIKEISTQREAKNLSSSHSARFEKEKIKPQKHRFMNLNEQVLKEVDNFAAKFEMQLLASWEKKYCSIEPNSNRERIALCARAAPQSETSQSFSDSSFRSWFGISTTEALDALKTGIRL